MKCSKKRCSREATPPYRMCERCRENERRYAKAYREKYPDAGRQQAARLRASQNPSAVAYRERSKASRAAASKAWIARNPERKTLTNRLNQLIARGKMVKPAACRDCGKAGKVVAWGIGDGPDGITVRAWVCWSCWWVRSRAQNATP